MNEELLAFFAVLSVSIFFLLYYYLVKHNVLIRFLIKRDSSLSGRASLYFFSEKATGIILTGILPAIIFLVILKINPSGIGFTAGSMNRIAYPLVILLLLVPLFSFYSTKNPQLFGVSPGLRVKTWQIQHIALSLLCWLIYLFGYELFFRGILWFLCYSAFGFWWSLIINTVLYSLVHLPKGKILIIGAIPFGILVCTLTHLTGSFFPAFLIHSIMAISAELFSVYHNPEFKFQSAKQ